MSHIPPVPPVPAPTGSFSSITRTIFCRRSGVVLANLELKIMEGYLPYLESHNESIYLHPLYQMSSTVLLKKMADALAQAQEAAWILIDPEKQRLRLLLSALMHSLDAIKQDQPGLPSFDVTAGSAGRVLNLAKWYFYVSSQRLAFPIYSVSSRNGNLDWNNFKFWLDAAFQLRKDWATKSRELQQEAELRAREQSIKEIKSEVYRKVDVNKVWNWVHIQLADHVAAGRLETFKDLFINGDINHYDWLADDVDDLQIEIAEYVDMGNEISHYIQKRLDGIRSLINEFYSGFTIVGATKSAQQEAEGDVTAKEQQFLDEFDQQAANLDTLPEEPQRSGFETTGKYLQAAAKWRILKKRWDQLQARKKNQPPESKE